jgi:hypothetical protein
MSFSGDKSMSILLTKPICIRDEDSITRAHLYIRHLSEMLLSPLPRTPSTSSRTVRPKGYVFPPSLSLSGPSSNDVFVIHLYKSLRCKFLNTRHTFRNTSLHPSPLRPSSRNPRPGGPSLTTTSTTPDSATTDTDHAPFDTPGPRFLCSPPRVRT